MDINKNLLGLARQPIFDQNLNVVAYELLYMPEQTTSMETVLLGDQEECSAFITHFTSIYDSGVLKELPAFLNVSENFIRSGALPTLSEHSLIINLHETCLTPQMLEKVNSYVEAGFRLVLDDFVYTEGCEALLKEADTIRIDVSQRSKQEIKDTLDIVSKYKVTCLADNLKNQLEFEELSLMGFQLFQGPFLARPTLVEGKKLSSNQSVVIHLLSALQDEDVTPVVLADIMGRDPILIFKLLKIVNSAKYSFPNTIESLPQAIISLGLNEINKWATLLALSSSSERPTELVRQILITARMCEDIAYNTQEVSHDIAFFCGVLSLLDALLEIDQQTLLTQLPISEEIIAAVSAYQGKAGKLLQAVNLYILGRSSIDLPLEIRELYSNSYSEALSWSNDAMRMMEGAYQ